MMKIPSKNGIDISHPSLNKGVDISTPSQHKGIEISKGGIDISIARDRDLYR